MENKFILHGDGGGTQTNHILNLSRRRLGPNNSQVSVGGIDSAALS